jgi:hypothetical protein
MDFEVTRMADMEQIVGFVFAAVTSHHPVVDVNSPERATVRTDFAPSTGTTKDFLTHLGRNGAHAALLTCWSNWVPMNSV